MIKLRSVYTCLIIALAGFLNMACEDIIDVKLDNAQPVLVIEGNISNATNIQSIKISRTQNIGDASKFIGVPNAAVTVTDSEGRLFKFSQDPQFPGLYLSTGVRPRILLTYNLRVEVDGKAYTSSSTMPAEVNLDSIGIITDKFFNQENKTIAAVYNDPQGIPNYYRFILYVNKIASKGVFVFSDKFNDGKEITAELRNQEVELKQNDIVKVEMQTIDKNVYKYFEGLDQNESRGGASTTPANPVSNISNGALGYFSAHTAQSGTVRIK